jgi:DNA-binding NarL/FixJ family response regulator
MQSVAGPVLCAPPNPDLVTILVAGTNPIYAAGLQTVLSSHSDLEVVAVVSSFDDLLRFAEVKVPSIIVLDEHIIQRDANRLKWILQANPRIRLIVAVSKEDQDFSLALLHAGARAIITHDVIPDHLARGLQKVMKEGYWITTYVQRWLVEFWQASGRPAMAGGVQVPDLSDKESIVVRMVLARKPNAHIALHLSTSEQTIKNMLSRLYKRLGVKDRSGLRSEARKWGIAPAGD